MRPSYEARGSDEGADRVLAVPVEARAVEAPEHFLERPAELDQLGEARQHRGRVHVAYATAGRHSGAKRERVPLALVALDRRIEVPGRDPPVMEAVAARVEH